MIPNFPALIASRYRPLRLIATGGMGAVYEVEHLQTGERLALKVLLSGQGSSRLDLERFKREARASARIKSEYVVRVLDADTAPELGGAFFLVMELLEGTNLEQATATSTPAPATVVAWLRQVAQALDKAHGLGIVHRDLKPANLFLATVGGGGSVVKVLDFGIAKLTEGGSAATETGQILGTPQYMAPEQATATVPVTPATDRCAVGLVAYRLLMGESYYQGGTMVVLAALLHQDLQPPSQRGSRFGPAFDAWFLKACHRDPEMRFSSAAEQVEALASALGVPSEGNASTLSSRAHPRRSPALVLWFAAGTAMVILGGSALWLGSRAANSGAAKLAHVDRSKSGHASQAVPEAPSALFRYTGVWGTSPKDVWVAGNQVGGRTGILLHWNGQSWTTTGARATGAPLPLIWGVWGAPGCVDAQANSDDVWAVTDDGSVLRKTRAGWTVSRDALNFDGDQSLLGLWGSDANNLWLVGAGGSVLRWNGASWSSSLVGAAAQTLWGVWGRARDDVWAVGAHGFIVHWDGIRWGRSSSRVTDDLFDIWGHAGGPMWVVGSSGALLRGDGTTWSVMPRKTEGALLGVWGSEPNDVWVAGFGGTLLHYDGVLWTTVQSGTTQTLNEVWGSGPNDVWAVGEQSTILHWDGKAWSAIKP